MILDQFVYMMIFYYIVSGPIFLCGCNVLIIIIIIIIIVYKLNLLEISEKNPPSFAALLPPSSGRARDENYRTCYIGRGRILFGTFRTFYLYILYHIYKKVPKWIRPPRAPRPCYCFLKRKPSILF